MSKPVIALVVLLLLDGVLLADQELRLEVLKDNSIVLHPDELQVNAGSQRGIRIKGNQHIVALAFNTSQLRGRRVIAAKLVCLKDHMQIRGVTISTIQADWDEMKSNALTSGVQDHVGWAWPGARFPAVTGSNSFSLVCQSKSVAVEGNYVWTVAPELVTACAVGASYGLAIHEWDSDYSRNPTIRSREEIRGRRPHLLVVVGGKSKRPEPPRDLELLDRGDPDSVRLRLRAPRDGFAYDVRVNGKVLPRWNIPFATPGEEQLIPIRDTGFRPGAPMQIEVATIGDTGQKSKSVSVKGRVPAPEPVETPDLPRLSRSAGTVPGLQAIPLVDKIDSGGVPVGDLPKDYFSRNAIFDGKTVRLSAARGEVVGFAALVTGKAPVTVKFKLPGVRTVLARAKFVNAGDKKIPGPLLPVGKLSLHPNAPAMVVADVYVPFAEKREVITGAFQLSDGRSLAVEITVRDFSLPRAASFLMEMNSYGVPDSVATYAALQDLAIDHRVHLNLLHYSHRTAAAGARKCTLDMRMANGRRMDEKRYNDIKPGDHQGYWDDLAAVFGPFLSGKHFARGHRGALALPGFYLTFHESWPLNLMPYYNGDPDAYEAFNDHPEYAETFVRVMRDFLHQAKREGWGEAGFQVYLNNKPQPSLPKETSPWTLDEPTAYHDYRALAFYGDLTRMAREQAPDVKLSYRIDISRPQFDRGELWEKADLWVVNRGAFGEYPRLLADRREFSGEEMWVYGQSSGVGESNRKLMAWALWAYRGGAKGLVPWQTINRNGKALVDADPLGIFIFDKSTGGEPAIRPTLRLKTYRRAQQDIEYLELMRERLKLTDGQVRQFIDHYLPPGEEWGPEEYRGLREAAAALIGGV